MRIKNPEAKGKAAAQIVYGFLLFASVALYFWGAGSIIVIDSSGSPGKYTTGITERAR